MRRTQGRNKRVGVGRDKGIRQEVVVKVLAVTTKTAMKIIDAALRDIQERTVDRVAAVTEAVGRKMSKKIRREALGCAHRDDWLSIRGPD